MVKKHKWNYCIVCITMSGLTDNERIHLKKLINESECEDNTPNIRRLKHSTKIRDDVRKIDTLQQSHEEMMINDNAEFEQLCIQECPFLYTNYTDIFNKLMKKELDLTIMTKLLIILKLIEDEKVDQHEGSVMCGKVLKELYIDSATKRMDNLDKIHNEEKELPNTGKSVSWKDYKKMQNQTT